MNSPEVVLLVDPALICCRTGCVNVAFVVVTVDDGDGDDGVGVVDDDEDC
jgi:hypothetical protein